MISRFFASITPLIATTFLWACSTTNDADRKAWAEQYVQRENAERTARYNAEKAARDARYKEKMAALDASTEAEHAAVREEGQRRLDATRAKWAKGPVEIGMTPQQVRQSRWGEPVRINKTTTAKGTREQWVYEGNSFLYFENDGLRTIQESE